MNFVDITLFSWFIFRQVEMGFNRYRCRLDSGCRSDCLDMFEKVGEIKTGPPV